jgi:LEA14-like dessication related protein
MQKRRGLSLFIGFALVVFLMSCSQPEAPEYRGFENIQVSTASGQGTVLSARLKFYNPNPFSLQLKHADLDIFLNDKHAGHSLLDSAIDIPRMDSFYIPVSLRIDMKSLFSNALQFLLKKEVKVRVEGKAKLKRGGFPFTVPLSYEGNQNLDSLFQMGF